MKRDLPVEFVRSVSYTQGRTPSDKPEIVSSGTLDLRNRPVLVVDEILDTGQTAYHLTEYLQTQGVTRIEWVFLVEKERQRAFTPPGARTGFHIPDQWVVGFGLDLDQRYRNLAGIYVLNDPEWNGE